MNQSFDQIQKLGQDNVNAALKTLGLVSKGAQVFATEAAEYAQKSLEQSNATFEKLASAKSLDKALEIQTDYLKTAYDALVAQSTRFGELCASFAKEAFKQPVETAVTKNAR